MSIAYVHHHQIDPVKWDACINNASNSLIYAQYAYLKAMTQNWDAVVIDDYKGVIPLVWKKKFGIKYIYQPAFIQYLGIFFKGEIDNNLVAECIAIAKAHFKYIDTTVNFPKQSIPVSSNDHAEEKINYILDLNNSYTEIFDNYHAHFHKSLRRIQKFNLHYRTSTNENAVMGLYQQLYGQRIKSVSKADIARFTGLCGLLKKSGQVHIREVVNKEGKLLASVILLSDEHRYYNIVSCVTEEGKKLEANYFLYDKIMEELSDSKMLFDFKGSNHAGIASFYKKFNPEVETYRHYRYNGLPKLLQLIKR